MKALRRRVQRRTAGAAVDRVAGLVATGLSTSQALHTAAACGGGVGRQLGHAARLLSRGRGVADALEQALPGLAAHEVAVLRSGEACGRSSEALALLNTTIQRDAEDAGRAVSALAYPCFILFAAASVPAVMALLVLPGVVSLYEGSDTALPLTTRWMLGYGDAVRSVGPLLSLSGAVAATLLGLVHLASEGARHTFDRALLSLPLIATLVLQRQKARAFSLLATMLEAGTPLAEALDLTVPTLGNRALRARFERLQAGLARGRSLAQAYERAAIDIGGADVELLRSAEAGGGYPSVLRRLAAVAARRHQECLTRALRLAEPASVALTAAAVAFSALALYQPILASPALIAGG